MLRNILKPDLASVTPIMDGSENFSFDDGCEAGKEKNENVLFVGHREVRTFSATSERRFSSDTDVRIMRKKGSVMSQTKSKTSQDDLALAVIEGNVAKVEEIIDAYVLLYNERGIDVVLNFLYDLNPDTQQVTCRDRAAKYGDQVFHDIGDIREDEMYSSRLSIIHLACIFDQEQVILFVDLKNE